MDSQAASSGRPRPNLSFNQSLSSSAAASEVASASSVETDSPESRRKAVQKVLQQCLKALEGLGEEADLGSDSTTGDASALVVEEEMEEGGESSNLSSTDTGYETDEVKKLFNKDGFIRLFPKILLSEA
jgi:hypothetical protein